MASTVVKSLLKTLSNSAKDLVRAVKGTPLFFWIYISALIYLAKKLSYRHGFGNRKIKVGDRIIFVDSAEEGIAESIINTSKIDVDFGSIGGLDRVKTALIEHVKWPFTRPELFTGKTLRSHPKGVLLYGPPGTGKTLLARALAKELGCSFINVKTESLFSKWIGDTEKNAAAVFSLAEKVAPCVIFVDEIDSLLGSRNNVDAAPHNHAKTIFMTRWDGLTQSNSKIVVVGATNRPLSIDDAIRRRLPLQLEVPPPDKESRRRILRILLDHDLKDSNSKEELIDFVASSTNNYTGSDLTEMCKAAAVMPLREMSENGEIPCLNHRHFSEALVRVKPTSMLSRSPMIGTKVLAKQFTKQGVQCEESSGILWCAFCTSIKGLQIIGFTKEDVMKHCATPRHLLAMEDRLPMDQYCPVEIDGQRMLFDHHCIYPSVMFGDGAVLFNETLGFAMAEDVCGGVKLTPLHKYTVVELVIPHSSSAIPNQPEYIWKNAPRASKRVELKTLFSELNDAMESERTMRKRRRHQNGKERM